MLGSTKQAALAHVACCPACSGSGRNVGTACCGGQGCSRCDRDCDTCAGEGVIEGYAHGGEVVSAERAAELHEDAYPGPCPVDECETCRINGEREPDDGCGGEWYRDDATERHDMAAAQRIK